MNALLDPRNHALARKANKHGMQNSLRIVVEAKAAGIPVSLAFAMVEQESSNGANVYGGDPTIFVNAGKVTCQNYLRYKELRDAQRPRKMQGVGPMQLTWWETQDAADKIGGCYKPACNLRVGFQTLAANIKTKGRRAGVKAYNGSGSAADVYTAHVNDVLAPKWHERLS